MSILQIIIGVCLLVLGFWGNNTYVSPAPLKMIFNVVLIIITIIVILAVFGIGGLGNVRLR